MPRCSKTTIPILAYHQILPQDEGEMHARNSPFTISTDVFEQQLKHLRAAGYKSIAFRDLELILSGKQVPTHPKIILISFDDGWLDNYEFAFPLLQLYGFTATFLVITSRIGERSYMTWEQLARMHDAGMEIGSHTHSHQPFELLDTDAAWKELKLSRQMIRANLQQDVDIVGFPHGSYTKETLEQAQKVGYRICATSNCSYATEASEAFELPRILMRNTTKIADFEAICRGDFSHMRQLRFIQQAKSLVKSSLGLRRYMQLHRLVYGTSGRESEHPKV